MNIQIDSEIDNRKFLFPMEKQKGPSQKYQKFFLTWEMVAYHLIW